MKRTRKPTVAGILDIVVGLFFVYFSVFWFIEGDEWAGVGILYLPFSIPALLGGVYALRRRTWWLALAGSAVSLTLLGLMVPLLELRLGVLLLSLVTSKYTGVVLYRLVEVLFPAALLVATVLIAVSKKEFA